MALNVGSRIAHYDVTALIGEGGMGEVYPRDTKLDQDVALKVLRHEEDLSGVHQLTEMLHASI